MFPSVHQEVQVVASFEVVVTVLVVVIVVVLTVLVFVEVGREVMVVVGVLL